MKVNCVGQHKNPCCKHSRLRKEIWPKDLALQNFDEHYSPLFGKMWPSIRIALLSPSKYCAVINNFSNYDAVCENLTSLGAVDVGQKYEEMLRKVKEDLNTRQHPSHLSEKTPKVEETSSTHIEAEDDDDQAEGRVIKMGSRLAGIGSDVSRSEAVARNLNEFIPATKLKGLEDWVDEGDFYSNYQASTEIKVQFEEENIADFPNYWKVFAFEKGDISRFPQPPRDRLGLLGYYMMDAASLLPVFALDVTPGDVVLDMCAAPGGKSLAILQTMCPLNIVCNDISGSRLTRLRNVFKSYIPDLSEAHGRYSITSHDGTYFENQQDYFNKILVDVPCTVDRHSVTENDNNIFKNTRIKERVKLPELQTRLLSSALKAVKVGGTVVYSTCSLSPVQNDGVVHMAIRNVWETTKNCYTVKNLSSWCHPMTFLFQVKTDTRYGVTVLPSLPANFGPSYVSKIVRNS